MAGQEVFYGPFSGGINTLSDPSAVAPNELIVAENFDIDIAGALRTRPPYDDEGCPIPLYRTSATTTITGGTPNLTVVTVVVVGNNTVTTTTDTDSSGNGSTVVTTQSNPYILGFYLDPTLGKLLIASDGYSSTYYRKENDTSWTLITSALNANTILQFYSPADARTVLWLFAQPGSTQVGGRWNGTTFTADANMPPAMSAVSFRDRMWINTGITNATWFADAVYMSWSIEQAASQYSNEMWPTAALGYQYVRIQAGDGQAIVAVAEYSNAILIFKDRSVYNYTFYADPFDTGYISVVLPAIGLENRDCLAFFDNYLYFLYGGFAYEFLGGRVDQISLKVVLTSADNPTVYRQHWVSILGRRVLFGVNDTVYVFHTSSRAFTTWRSTAWGAIGPTWEYQNPFSAGGLTTAFMFPSTATTARTNPTSGVTSLPLSVITDTSITDSAVSNTEGPGGLGFMLCHLRTPYYFYDKPSNFKRLYWWGLDCDMRDVTMDTIIYNAGALTTTTWNQLYTTSTWGTEILQGDTWGRPQQQSITTADYAVGDSSLPRRALVKFQRPLRFRQVAFDIQYQSSGAYGEAAEIYRLATYIAVRETVVAKVS